LSFQKASDWLAATAAVSNITNFCGRGVCF